MPAQMPTEEDYEYEAVSRDSGSSEASKMALVGSGKEALGGKGASARQQRVEVRRPIWRRLGIAMFMATAVVAVGGGVVSLGLPRLLAPLPAAPSRPSAASPAAAAAAAQPAARPMMTAHDVANALSEYAQLGRQPAAIEFDKIQKRAREVVPDMSAKDVSRTLDAYAKLKKRPEDELLTALGQRAQQVVGDMDAQDVTDTINAYAELGEQITVPGEKPLQELSLDGAADTAMEIAEAP